MSIDNLKKSVFLASFNLLHRVSPVLTLKILFRMKVGYPLNLERPRTYSKKLQWIKLYDHNPVMAQCCDKFAVRGYVESKGCGSYLNELPWQGFNPADIPFNELPDQYLVKVTHGLTFNVIVGGPKLFDRDDAIRKSRKRLRAKILPCYGEWFYGVERPRVIVERYLDGDGDKGLLDYKVFCFNGQPKLIAVYSDRDSECHEDVFDLNWSNRGFVGTYPRSGRQIAKPVCLDEMISVAKVLSADFNHARVDFFICDGAPVFGELTFTLSAGFARYGTIEMDYPMGSWLKLPAKKVA